MVKIILIASIFQYLKRKPSTTRFFAQDFYVCVVYVPTKKGGVDTRYENFKDRVRLVIRHRRRVWARALWARNPEKPVDVLKIETHAPTSPRTFSFCSSHQLFTSAYPQQNSKLSFSQKFAVCYFQLLMPLTLLTVLLLLPLQSLLVTSISKDTIRHDFRI